MADRLDQLKPKLFLDGPSEYLVKSIASAIAAEPHFKKVFGLSVFGYDREDISIRELPACRVYSFDYRKESETSGYIVGDVLLDVILPPSIRREECEEFSSRISTAMLQQFRRAPFFQDMIQAVPGLNELGKIFAVDKRLTYQNTQQEDECPVVHMTLNFRIDLKIWDEYLEKQGRTRDDPFDVTLENLMEIAARIQGIKSGSDLTTGDVVIEAGPVKEGD